MASSWRPGWLTASNMSLMTSLMLEPKREAGSQWKKMRRWRLTAAACRGERVTEGL